MNKARGIFRGLGLVFLTLWYLTPILVRSAIRGVDLTHALELRRRWARKIIPFLGVTVIQRGYQPHNGPLVYISNHRSYIDPVIALREIKALPVAKAEVSSWPLIGFAARATGIHFVKRESRSSRRATLEGMKLTVDSGQPVLLYPEGTTHTNDQVMPFKRGAFSLVAMEEYSIIPIAIDYGRRGDAWIGDDTFLPHFIRTFGNAKTEVWIDYGVPIRGKDSKELVRQTEAWINERLRTMKQERESRVPSTTISRT